MDYILHFHVPRRFLGIQTSPREMREMCHLDLNKWTCFGACELREKLSNKDLYNGSRLRSTEHFIYIYIATQLHKTKGYVGKYDF